MGKGLVQFLSATLRLPLWLSITVAIGVAFGALGGLFALGFTSDFHIMWWIALFALLGLWLVLTAVYFSARIYRHYRGRGRKTPLIEALGIIAAFHALGLAALLWLLWGPLNHQRFRNYTAELTGFDYPVLTAIFLSMWAFVSVLIALRYEKLGRFDATRTQLACAIGICGVLLLFAVGAQSAAPGFSLLYESSGEYVPGPIIWLLLAIYPYWYALPLLGAVMASGVLLVSGSHHRVRGGAFDGLIGLLVMMNLAMVAGLITMYSPAFIIRMCQSIDSRSGFLEAGFTRLHVAASLGREESVLRRIAAGDPVNGRDERGTTPLMFALAGSHEKATRALLAKGADVNAANKFGKTALHQAVTDAHQFEVMVLLAHGAEVNAATDDGYTPLHFAAASGRTDVAALLLAKGAEVNATVTSGTPLDLAYEYKHDQLAKLLLQHGAVRATEQQREAKTPSMSPEIVMVLLEHAAGVNAAMNSGNTPLHLGAVLGRTDVAALLLAKGAEVNATAASGTPLDLAYEYQHDQLAKLLLQQGAVRATEQQREAKKSSIKARAVTSGRSCG